MGICTIVFSDNVFLYSILTQPNSLNSRVNTIFRTGALDQIAITSFLLCKCTQKLVILQFKTLVLHVRCQYYPNCKTCCDISPYCVFFELFKNTFRLVRSPSLTMFRSGTLFISNFYWFATSKSLMRFLAISRRSSARVNHSLDQCSIHDGQAKCYLVVSAAIRDHRGVYHSCVYPYHQPKYWIIMCP